MLITRRGGPPAPNPGWFGRVEPEMQTYHPDQEAHYGRTKRNRDAEQGVDTAAVGGHEQRSTDQSRDRVQSAVQHAGNPPDQHIPDRSAAHPCDRPKDDGLRRSDTELERLARSGYREQSSGPRRPAHRSRWQTDSASG
jgi:hypothetical protein